MNTTTLSPKVEIQNAETALRDLLSDDFRRDAREDAGSLDRTLIHLKNIQEGIESTPACRPNAAKRLNDFAVTMSRMAMRHPQSVDQFAKVSEALRTAGASVQELASSTEEGKKADAA
jgi:hypothetical protein